MQVKMSLSCYYTVLECVCSVCSFLKRDFLHLESHSWSMTKPNTSQEASCCVHFSSFQHNYANPSLTLEKGQWQCQANVIQFSLSPILGIHRVDVQVLKYERHLNVKENYSLVPATGVVPLKWETPLYRDLSIPISSTCSGTFSFLVIL